MISFCKGDFPPPPPPAKEPENDGGAIDDEDPFLYYNLDLHPLHQNLLIQIQIYSTVRH